jgi:hypothetical protein
MLAFLGYYNMFSSFCSSAQRTILKVYDAVRVALSPHYYIFFNGVDQPLRFSTVDLHAPGSAQPLWVYSQEANTFYEWPMHETDTINPHSLPILSLEIHDGDTVLHDLTEFVGTMRVHVRGDDKFSPSISHILGAWTLTSKIVLNPKLTGASISSSGESSSLELNSATFIRPEAE